MKSKISNKVIAIIFFITAILYFILFFKDKNYSMLTFGFVFTTFGFVFLTQNKK